MSLRPSRAAFVSCLSASLAGFLAGDFQLRAATITARSVSLVDVNAAITSAANGDTVIVPPGTATWLSGLIITKPITLLGQTTVTDTNVASLKYNDQTIIQDGSSTGYVIRIDVPLGKSCRVSGFTFAAGPATGVSSNGLVDVRNNSHAVRIDHCHFRQVPRQSVYIYVHDAVYGVSDHIVMECPHVQAYKIDMRNWPNPDGSAGQYGDGSWAAPSYLGSEKFFFIEDNYIANVCSPYNEYCGNVDSTSGGRWVFRHNHCVETLITNHGTVGLRERGCRVREIYGNDFHYNHAHPYGGSSSGVTITHDNTWVGVRPTKGITMGAPRVNWLTPTWGGGSGKNPWDVNDVRSGPLSENGFNYNPVNGLYESGIVSSGSLTSIVDTTKHWTPNQWVNFAVNRLVNNTLAQVMSNTSNTLTVVSITSGTTSQAHWTAGDKYEIRRPLILLDQPGRGQSDLISGVPPINRTTGNAAWPHNALEPGYSWNDKYTPTNSAVNFDIINHDTGLQFEGRDYYNNTPMPGYKPYVYPHPLTSDLAPPSDLTIVP